MNVIVHLSDADLLARMKNFENHLVERKTVKDEKDWKKTAVAFANSAPIGTDEIQKKFNNHMERVYPRIACIPKIVTDNGRQALAVIILGSELRPHFAGLAYVRRGSVTSDASDSQLRELIAQRNSKTARLLEWKGMNVTVVVRSAAGFESEWPTTTELIDCDQFYVTVRAVLYETPRSFPLSRIEINFDNLRNRIQLEIPSREPWDEVREAHVRTVVRDGMIHEGQLLLRWLLMLRRIECGTQFLPQISIETQTNQLDIAVKNGIVERQEEHIGLRRTYYAVNSDMKSVLERVIAEVLK